VERVIDVNDVDVKEFVFKMVFPQKNNNDGCYLAVEKKLLF